MTIGILNGWILLSKQLGEQMYFFKGNREEIAAVDIDGPIRESAERACSHYLYLYDNAAKEAEESGRNAEESVYSFLSNICSFHQKFDDDREPFGPRSRSGETRSPIPSDLSESDLEAVRILAGQSANAPLKARLFDLLWLTGKGDFQSGKLAAEYYCKAAGQQEQVRTWRYSAESFSRALSLSVKFGRDKSLYQMVQNAVIEAAKAEINPSNQYHCLRLMKILLRQKIGDPQHFAAIAEGNAGAVKAFGRLRTVVEYYDLEAEWHRAAKDIVAHKAALLKAAEIVVEDAQLVASHSYMAAAARLGSAIERFQRGGAPKERVSEVKGLLSKWQMESMNEMHRISTPPIDVTESVKRAREMVSSLSFPEALERLAFGDSLVDPEEAKRNALELDEAAPLVASITQLKTDRFGRPRRKMEGLLFLKGDAYDRRLEEKAFEWASQWRWHYRALLFIEPARTQNLNEHVPSIEDLGPIVSSNPFIPPGHEWAFLKGLHAGFHGDYHSSSYFLTPQIESSIRYILQQHGVDVSNFETDGTQSLKLTGGLLELEATRRILGEELFFEIRGIFVAPGGYEFRHQIAHGFATDRDCASPAAICVWWLILRLCLTSNRSANANHQQ